MKTQALHPRGRDLRKRDLSANEWDSNGEETVRKRQKRPQPDVHDVVEDVVLETLEDEQTRKDRERLEDLRERDAFADRVRTYDRQKTKIVEDRSSKTTGAAAEAAQRRLLADDQHARSQALPSLRQHSRQEYLTKRELQRIELLRKEIEDDEALFRNMKISQQERHELEYKKELLKLVQARLKIDDKYQSYEEAKQKDDPFATDADQWEASQTLNSSFRTGALDKQDIVQDYEYVFDESQTIKFVLDTAMADGLTLSPADKLLQAKIDEAEKRCKYL